MASTGGGGPAQIRSMKSFFLRLPQRNEPLEFHLEGRATLADLAAAALSLAKRELGDTTKLSLSGLPASDPYLTLDELKIKAPHQLKATYAASPGPMKSPRTIVASSGSSALSLRELDEPAISWSDTDEIERRIRMRVQKYAGFVELSPPDPSKKVVVLDIDFTILGQ